MLDGAAKFHKESFHIWKFTPKKSVQLNIANL